MPTAQAAIMAGIPSANASLYHRIRFLVGDPAAVIDLPGNGATPQTILILRDIEMQRARQHARADRVACPGDFAPDGGLSGDRETATAQAAAQCLRRAGVAGVRADRTLPLIFAEHIRLEGISIEYDPELGVIDRRSKDEQEIQFLREAQATTEGAMAMACEAVARARPRADGVLVHQGEPLTSERLMGMIDVWLLERGYTTPGDIVAGGPVGADCHESGHGPLRTGEPIIIDIFPQNRATHYNGDCTRTVVHGDVPDVVAAMHEAVAHAKAAGIAATRAGATGQEVYRASMDVIERHGWGRSVPGPDAPDGTCSMQHGLGHGVGLDVHEAPLLDEGGPELIVGDALTIEPGLYRVGTGGVRIEDMVIVTPDGCENLNTLAEGLTWA